jgi:UDP-N-acetylmuramoyl-tripeptide--D-alanyl-D-alanine ligase
MISKFLSLFSPKYPQSVIYMLQKSEYRLKRFLPWYFSFPNFNQVMNRGQLKKTVAAKVMLLSLILAELGLFISGIILSLANKILFLGPLLILSAPVLAVIIICPFLIILKIFYLKPRWAKQSARAQKIFASTKAKKIAILGSYGKTTVKELLAQVLSEKYKVAYTPGNMNTLVAHARFALSLKGDEQFIIIEYGEEELGDIAKMAEITKPDYAILTGMAPVHMDSMGSLNLTATELGSILDFVDSENVFWNSESELLAKHLGTKLKKENSYCLKSALGAKISQIDATSPDGLKFKLGDLNLSSGLIGKHMVGPLGLVAELGKRFGLNDQQIKITLEKTQAFEARMQPLSLNGATIINDGYNGNIEGIKAGIELLLNLKCSGRKIYVTPGLIMQGQENDKVHSQIGSLLGASNFEQIYLVRNKNTEIIFREMNRTNFSGQVEFIEDPLSFYTNVQSFLAKGDIILMQNDLPDGA